MWKFGKDDQKPASRVAPAMVQPKAPVTPAEDKSQVAPKERNPVEPSKPIQTNRAELASIGKSVVVKGELSGSEDLYLDGEVEGSIELRGHSLTVGPNGRVRAHIHARDIIVHGRVDGNLYGGERVELRRTATLVGDIVTQRVAIEDGAFFKGAIDVQKSEAKPLVQQAAAAAPATNRPPVASGANGSVAQNASVQPPTTQAK
jgi:cytoskeletal protein CcmA (bactofilin family)